MSSPDVSFVMPCYNEEAIVGHTISHLMEAFEKAGHELELIAVDNGSADRTGEIIREMRGRHPGVIHHRVEMNEGYGNGILAGLPLARAPWVGIIPADGQTDPEDVVRLYLAARLAKRPVLAKVRRRFRMDGLNRKVVSVTYNLFVRLLWPRLASLDINGSPKLLPREALEVMDLHSRGWLLDPEIMIKAHYLGLPVLELNVFARMRGGGMSHVNRSACWEFFRELLEYRFSGKMLRWRREASRTMQERQARAAR